MAHWAKAGVKCVCINGNGWYDQREQQDDGPRKGDVCTIKSASSSYGRIWLVLEEWPGAGYAIEGFRPLVSQADDVAMFKAIADKGLAQNGIHVPSSSPEHA